MRNAALAVLFAAPLLLAGCTQDDPGAGPEEFGSCPSWIKYPHNGQVIDGALLFDNQTTQPDFVRWDFMEPNATRRGNGIGDGHLLEYRDHPLDQIVFDFHLRPKNGTIHARTLYTQDAELHLRFHASDGGHIGEPVEAYDAALGPAFSKHEWVFRPEPGKPWAIHNLTLRIDHALPDEPPAPRGVFLEWEMVPDLDRDIDTPSIALMKYVPEFWYRTCSADGTRH